MKFLVPQTLKDLAEKIDFPIYIVGGYVRNALAGLKPSDIDICGEKIIDENNIPSGFYIVSTYKRMGTALIKSENNPSLEIEYTAFRKEKYKSGGHHTPSVISFGANIEEDAYRRDFTINSIYYDIKNDKVVDPINGLIDIEKRLIRAINPEKVFSSDGLRLMRLIRIAAETGFDIEEKTKEVAISKAALLKDITINRIYDELYKILIADTKYGVTDAHYRGLKLIKEHQLLEYIIQELKDMDGLKQNPTYHKYDVLEHTFLTVKNAKPRNRLAALLHDIGKPKASKETGMLFDHETYGAEISREIVGQAMFNLPKKEADRIIRLVRWHMYDKDRKTKEGKLKLFVANNVDILDDLIDLMNADEIAHGINRIRQCRLKEVYDSLVESNAPLKLSNLKINGGDLTNLGYNGSNIKKELEFLHRECILNPKLNRRAWLLSKAKEDLIDGSPN